MAEDWGDSIMTSEDLEGLMGAAGNFPDIREKKFSLSKNSYICTKNAPFL